MAKNQNNNVAPATQQTEPGAKKDALATALAQIEKQFGKGAIKMCIRDRVVIVSVFLYSVLPWSSTSLRVLFKLLLLPVVMGLSYELRCV